MASLPLATALGLWEGKRKLKMDWKSFFYKYGNKDINLEWNREFYGTVEIEELYQAFTQRFAAELAEALKERGTTVGGL